MSKKFFGVIPPIPTPIDCHEHVDEKALRAVIDHCLNHGIHGIFVCGTNGECMALSQKERNRAIAIALDHCKGRAPVMAGCMDSSTERVIDNIKALEDMGGDTAVVTACCYSRHSTTDETIRHFEKISERTNANLFIYNIPAFVGYTIPVKAVFQIAEFDHVVGYKDTSGQFSDFISCLRHFKNTDFMLFQGMTSMAAASMLLGADGYIPNIAPILPEICIKIFEYAKAGDIEKTMSYHDLLMEAQNAFSIAKYGVAACKAAVSALGLCAPDMCQPSEPVTLEQLNKIMSVINSVTQKASKLNSNICQIKRSTEISKKL